MPTLNWIGKEAVVNHDKEIPFRLLKKIESLSIGDNSQNLIIHGDNLEALKALMPYYQGRIKSIYIDPPYNRQRFVDRLDLDALPNIKFWIRNREKKDPFYLQGWRKNKFYPDFIVLTTHNNILALEWKGEDRLSNADTMYKEEIARIWEKLGKGKLYFFLIHKKNVEESLKRIKLL